MSGVLTATAVTAYAGNEARKSANDQYDESNAMMRAQQAQNRADMMPYTSAGTDAMAQIRAQLGLDTQGKTQVYDVTRLPGYQQALQQGLAGVNQSAASAGMLMSGERLKGLQSAGQNIFGSYYQNYMDRLTGMADRGANSAAGVATANSNLSSNMYAGMNDQANNNFGAKMGLISGVAGGIGKFAGSFGGGGGGGGIPPGQGVPFDPQSGFNPSGNVNQFMAPAFGTNGSGNSSFSISGH